MHKQIQEMYAAEPALETITAEINREADLADAAMKTGLQHALRAGELLTQMKEKVPFGLWLLWLKENFCTPDRADGIPASGPGYRSRSERSAQLYMQLYRSQCLRDPQCSADLSIAAAIKVIASKSTPPLGRVGKPPPGWRKQIKDVAKAFNVLTLARACLEPEHVAALGVISSEPSPDEVRRIIEWLSEVHKYLERDADGMLDIDARVAIAAVDRLKEMEALRGTVEPMFLQDAKWSGELLFLSEATDNDIDQIFPMPLLDRGPRLTTEEEDELFVKD